MIRIKICGMTNRDDAMTASDLGADAVGFIFYTQSPRFIEPTRAAEIIAQLPPFVVPVGVFVDEEERQIRQILRKCDLQVLQFHGKESPSFCGSFREKVIKSFRVDKNHEKDRSSLLKVIETYPVDAVLLDAYVPSLPGGTGQTFNWGVAVEVQLTLQGIKPYSKLILSGGLTPGNVANAVQQVRPYAVDVSSGVESTPGKKDPQKMKAFINAARAASTPEKEDDAAG
ncbi:MAG: phosphoribosylanthranilate isomerase [Nitrospirae bacterium]|nr:phosphoribosylanthranilate isomerase [Nitrospirota bacterium]